ncbi:MAG: hypothetical protein OXR66_06100 [Candidatus Woesearchaeota archaeon]|nr:hypothetical protein [Candidatus Woesearchaeota archaeon]
MGIRRAAGFGLLKSGLYRLYQEIRGGKKSFSRDLERQIMEQRLPELQGKTLLEAARATNREDLLKETVRDELKFSKSYVKRALDGITNVKDGLEDIIETAEVKGSLVTGGAAQVTNILQLPIYLAVQTAYTAVKGVLGFGTGMYRRNLFGLKDYAIDTVKGYVGAIGSSIFGAGSIFEWMTNMDDVRPRMATSLAQKVHEKMGESLDNIVKFHKPVEQGSLEEYDHERAEGYGHDTALHPGYARLAAA